MSYAGQIAEEIQEREGWTDTTLLGVVLDYIGNQDSDGAFRDYLTQRSAEDAELGDPYPVDHDWISETLCKCGAQFGSARSMTAHMEWANAAEVNPCDVPEAEPAEERSGAPWAIIEADGSIADRFTTEDEARAALASGGYPEGCVFFKITDPGPL